MNFEKIIEEIKNCSRCSLRLECERLSLQPAFPGGCLQNPLMLIFINPTPKNLTCKKGWSFDRLFFFGDFKFWHFLSEVGLFNKEILEKIKRNGWVPKYVKILKEELNGRGIYITNLVKCPTLHGEYPPKEVINCCREILNQEITLLKPQKIIAFGSFTFKTLMGKEIKLKEFYQNLNKESLQQFILPAFFPTGRGNFHLAVKNFKQLLSLIKNELQIFGAKI